MEDLNKKNNLTKSESNKTGNAEKLSEIPTEVKNQKNKKKKEDKESEIEELKKRLEEKEKEAKEH